MIFACSSRRKTEATYPNKDAIDLAIKSKKSEYVGCYENFMQIHPGFEGGKVLLKWVINNAGQAKNIEVVKSNIKDERLEQCFVKIVATIQFPQSKGEDITIKYPFNFSKNID